MWDLEYDESWVLKNWCFWTVVLKTLESPLDSKKIKPVNPKGNQSWIYIGRTDGEAEAPILWPPDGKSQLTEKDPDAWKDWRQEEKGTIEVEMAGWHQCLDGCEFEEAPGIGDGEGSLVCYSTCHCKESDMTEQLNWTDSNIWMYHHLFNQSISGLTFCPINLHINLHQYHCLYYCSLKLSSLSLLTLFCFFKIVLATQLPLLFHLNFRISFSSYRKKNPNEIFTGIVLNL